MIVSGPVKGSSAAEVSGCEEMPGTSEKQAESSTAGTVGSIRPSSVLLLPGTSTAGASEDGTLLSESNICKISC